MSELKETVTVNYNNGDPVFASNPAAVDLYDGDWIVVNLSGAGQNNRYRISTIAFYHNKVVDNKDTKDLSNPAGSWNDGDSTKSVAAFILAPDNSNFPTRVQVTDNEDPAAPDKYWFSCTVKWTDGFGAHQKDLDPELVLKRRPH